MNTLLHDINYMLAIGGLANDIQKITAIDTEEVLKAAVKKSVIYGKPLWEILSQMEARALRGEKIEIEEVPMSESREKKRRYNQRLQYIAEFNKWLDSEPPMIRLVSWARWKKRRPVWEETV